MALVKNTQTPVVPSSPTSELLRQFKQGVYTTARTVKRTSIMGFEDHITRLKSFITSGHQYSHQEVCDHVLPAIKLAVEAFLEQNKDSTNELKISILAIPKNPVPETGANVIQLKDIMDLVVHVDTLTPFPLPPVIVEIRTFKRENPTIKHLEWPSIRKALEDVKAKEANEVVMQDDEGLLYEGLSSNFFTVENGVVHTAPDDVVLPGTIRKLIVKCCQENNIPIVFERPNIKNIDSWEGCFLSSTSRLLLPIDEVRLVTQLYIVKKISNSPFVTKLRGMIEKEILEHATKI